ncbi:MAG: DUF3006 domain-containing protein [Deltaproteobacteria bacterium]|nr:DUF3006 domain-containing protein [Deltaproteobacteria bacterium]
MTAPFVDRIEGEIAVLVIDGQEQRVPVAQLPPGAKEGAFLTPDLKAVDPQAAEALKAEIQARRDRLREKDDDGDFSL